MISEEWLGYITKYRKIKEIKAVKREKINNKKFTHKKIPKAVHICQLITKPPLMLAGQFSAAYIGTVLQKKSI